MLLDIRNLHKSYSIGGFLTKAKKLHVLKGLSLQVPQGQTVAVVGESGCGKTTLAKVIMGIEDYSEGEILFEGVDLKSISRAERAKNIQIIFQDPYSSLNPRKTVFDIIAEPAVINLQEPTEQIRKKVFEVAEKVGLRPEFLSRYPHMFSGGQRQRIGIARALITKPKLIICDEPVSALDVSVQAQVLNLLMELQKSEKLTYMFISHDLSVVQHISHWVGVMYLGEFVEQGESHQLFSHPLHPYTNMLLESTPRVSGDKTQSLAKEFKVQDLPSPMSPPSGCAFHTRCRFAQPICQQQVPGAQQVLSRFVRCHRLDATGEIK